MGIINTLEKCLDSPYLFHDPEAPARVGGLLRPRPPIASRMPRDRRQQPDRATRPISRLMSYEAMFACVRALVYAKGYREAGLRCLLLACEKLYVLPGQLDPSLIHAFEKAQGLRALPKRPLAAADLARTNPALLQPRLPSERAPRSLPSRVGLDPIRRF